MPRRCVTRKYPLVDCLWCLALICRFEPSEAGGYWSKARWSKSRWREDSMARGSSSHQPPEANALYKRGQYSIESGGLMGEETPAAEVVPLRAAR
jgi:hypothetical protein